MSASPVLNEWRRAGRALQADQILYEDGFLEDAVSRSYYAVMHAAKAALLLHERQLILWNEEVGKWVLFLQKDDAQR